MKFLWIAVILAVPVFAEAGRHSARWAREEAQAARVEARQAVRQTRLQAERARMAAHRDVLRLRIEASRDRRAITSETQQYRRELIRELRDHFRDYHPRAEGMKRIF